MAFTFKNSKGVTYYLHANKRRLKSGKAGNLYFFTRLPGDSSIDAPPPGYVVVETKSGLPVLKKK